MFIRYIDSPDVYLPHRMIFNGYIDSPDVYLPHRMIFMAISIHLMFICHIE